ncbi:MAG: Plug domain-containing protein, partial [Gammaproteobacteria bacterium]
MGNLVRLPNQINLSSLSLMRAALLASLVFVCALAEADLEEIVVTAEFSPTDSADVPSSVVVLDSTLIKQAGTQHFEELSLLVPNLSYSGEGNRAQYFQIRGVGELAQYEGAPNPSVGFIVDDVDFSGLGGIATLFDVDRIEVLRGPQGTRYGANALAGLVYVTTAP